MVQSDAGRLLAISYQPQAFVRLSASHGAHDQQRLRPIGDRVRQRLIHWFMGEILLTCKEPDEGAPFVGRMITDGSTQHGIANLERVEHRLLGYGASDIQRHFTIDASQSPQVLGQDDTYHKALSDT